MSEQQASAGEALLKAIRDEKARPEAPLSQEQAMAFKAKSIARGKLLERFRATVQEIVEHAENEGDRVYFGTTNHFETLKDIADEMDSWNWDAIIRERKQIDPYAELRQQRARAEKAEAATEKLADKIEDLIAEFGDDEKAALQCVSEYLQLRRHPMQEER